MAVDCRSSASIRAMSARRSCRSSSDSAGCFCSSRSTSVSGRGVAKIRAGEVSLKAEDYPQGVIVQPYIREIETAGETSLVFFDGHFSHAVLRMPPQGEWRANSAYGVSVFGIEPPEFAVRAAQNVLATLPQMPVYARVDGTLVGDTFLLNELELVEPALYLHTAENAVADMVQAVKRVIAG